MLSLRPAQAAFAPRHHGLTLYLTSTPHLTCARSMAMRPLHAQARNLGESTHAKVDELYQEICERDAASRMRAADPDGTGEVRSRHCPDTTSPATQLSHLALIEDQRRCRVHPQVEEANGSGLGPDWLILMLADIFSLIAMGSEWLVPFAMMLRGAAALLNPHYLSAPYCRWSYFIAAEVTLVRVAIVALIAVVTAVRLAHYTDALPVRACTS